MAARALEEPLGTTLVNAIRLSFDDRPRSPLPWAPDDTVDGPRYLANPFHKEPDWGAASVNYHITKLHQVQAQPFSGRHAATRSFSLAGRRPYVVGQLVHFGSAIEVDVATFDRSFSDPSDDAPGLDWQFAAPSVAVETELLKVDNYEVQILDV